MKIGIIGAMESEISALKDMMTGVGITTHAHMDFFTGKIYDKDIVLVKSGVGKVNAAAAAQILCDLFMVTHIINTGAAGSLDTKINIWDIVIAHDAVQHDMDCTGLGAPLGKIPFFKKSYFASDEKLRMLAADICGEICTDIVAHEGRVASGDKFVCDSDTKKYIRENFDAMCCEMEGAAIMQVAYINDVPCLVLRAISDTADDSAEMDYPAFERMAARHSIKILSEMIKRMQE